MRHQLVALAFAVCALAACNGGEAPDLWSPPDISAAPSSACAERIRVDLYVDATTSMGGYAAPTTSEFLDFLDGAEAAISSAWADDSIRYYKFGETVRAIDRGEFRGVREPAFYNEAGIFARTNIDAVVQRTDADRVAVVVTDLFQDDGDVNAVVASIKANVLANRLAVGVLALPSAFDGTVYDAPGGSYPYASTASPDSRRPFYALLFGETACLRRLHEVFETRPYAQDSEFLLAGPAIVSDYSVTLSRAEGDRGLSLRQSPGPNQAAFNLSDSVEEGLVQAEVVLTPIDGSPAIDASRLVLTGQRRSRSPADSLVAQTEEFEIRSAEQSEGGLSMLLGYRPTSEGQFSYLLRVGTSDIGGLAAPAWVRSLSTRNPTAESDANLTLNLERFVNDLLQAASSAHPPAVAQFVVDVNRL